MIEIWKGEIPGWDPEIDQKKPSVTPYVLAGDGPKGAVLVLPGGGYHVKAPHEGEPIALWLNSIGLNAFTLDYRVFPYRHPCPLMDAQRALRFIRHNSRLWNIDPEKIAVLGFSAGGHLASTLGTSYDRGNSDDEDCVEMESCRPDAMVLCYPVISFTADFSHKGSYEALLGRSASPELTKALSNENNVTDDTPPAFLWHTAEDSGVPPENSIIFALELSKHKVPYDLHVYAKGNHGLGLAKGITGAENWTLDCKAFFMSLGFI